MIRRRSFLAGSSMLVLSVCMPTSGAVALDHKAFGLVVERVRQSIRTTLPNEQHWLFKYCLGELRTVPIRPSEWADADDLSAVVHRTLRIAFQATREAARKEQVAFTCDGELSFFAQMLVLGYLPIRPDLTDARLVEALSACVPHYLS